MKRREYLTGLAGLGAVSGAAGQVGADTGLRRLNLSSAVGDDTHHPGAPRFAPLGVTFYDRLLSDFSSDHAGGKDRDSFAPQIVGDPQQEADNYSPDDFSWSLVESPDGSTATIEYRPPDGDMEQWTPDPAPNNVAEFNPDVPGRYVLELDAPDGTHHQELHIFPEDGSAGGPPRISIEGEYDSDAEEFVLDSNPKLAPNSQMSEADLMVAWLADTRDALTTEDIQVGEGMDSWTARIPKSALGGESCRVHAAPNDSNASGVTDTVVLNPDEDAVEYPNRPPEWAKDGIMYQIFPRSFMGPPEEGEWPLENSNANFANFEEKLDYLEELNTDVIWFTPTVPGESSNWKPQNADEWIGPSNENAYKYVGGGPHAYDAISYFQKAEDLTSEYSFSDYADEPWPWEDGYDPETNVREQARQSAMEEFQSFLDAAHERDIKVCLDFVINHGARHHPLLQDTIGEVGNSLIEGYDEYPRVTSYNEDSKYFDWFNRSKSARMHNGEAVEPAPAYRGFANLDLRSMPQWNYSNMALREHILAAAKHWAEMDVDAFRCDIAYGVPHGMWKEIREVVRAENTEFMMLDETIPNDPTFAESEFDMHFDTSDFMTSAGHGVVNGGDPMQLYDSVYQRKNEGWPDHALIINSTENHDEFRLMDIAKDGSRADPAKAQRAVWASGVLLEGVPFIYYGQERLITEYGHERYNYDGTGEDYRSGDGDVGPGNPARAFMNWEENGDTVPQEHLQFYKDVTQFYTDHDIFKPDAELSGAWFQSDDSVLAFGRSMETDDGEQNVIVLLHFDPGTATVDLLPGANTQDMFTDSDIGVDSESEATTVEFETLAVVETDSLFNLGSRISQFDDPVDDDTGPGSYTYPTTYGDDSAVFDITEASIHSTADTLQFRVALNDDLAVDDDGKIVDQHLQFYLRNPEAESGATDGRTGTNVTFEESYQFRLIANNSGAWVEDHEGNEVATGSMVANPVADEIVVEMPKGVLNAGIRSHYIAPLLLGYDGDADGSVMAVQAEASETAFGGAETPGMAPRVIDMVVGQGDDQSEALSSYGSDSLATLPFTPLASDYELLGRASDSTGDDNGPGFYEYPTGDPYYDGAFDIEQVNLYESRSRVRFEYVMRTEVQNPWGEPNGMSQQFAMVCIRDPEAGDDVVSTTAGYNGLGANFADPYHYRVIANPKEARVDQFQVNDDDEVESAGASTDVNLIIDGKTLAFDVPKSAIGGSPEGKQLAALLAPADGYGTGLIRQNFASSPGEHDIGVGDNPTENAPRVMDMITPAGTSQAQALAYTESSPAQIPFASWDSTFRIQEGLGSISDPEGDDVGPGEYTYPNNLTKGMFDVTNVSIESKAQNWEFTVDVGVLENQFGNDAGFSTQLIQLYLQDPNAPDDAPTGTAGSPGVVSSFLEDYHYLLHVEAGSTRLENGNHSAVIEDISASGSTENNTITFSLPKSEFNTDDLTQMKAAMLVFSQDGFGTNGIRQDFSVEAGDWAFGGAIEDATGNAPRALELVGPDNVVKQSESLAYSADSKALIPLFSVESLISGVPTGGSGVTAIAAPGPTLFAGTSGQLDASKSSDPEEQTLSFQWAQIGGPTVELSGTDTAKPTFTAPESVEEETTLEFEVTVTDPDDNSATATTTATVRPQSENDAPVARVTNGDRTVDPGDIVLLDGAPSEDPNGGELSFQWSQSGGEPSVELSNAEESGAAFTAPEVDSETTLTFTLTVSDGQGKTASTDLNITVRGTGGGTETEDDDGGDTGSGFGPGFGVVSGALGTAGGAAYAARRLLGEDEPAQPDDVDVDDVEEPADD